MTAIIMVVDQAVAMTFWQVVLVQGWHGDFTTRLRTVVSVLTITISRNLSSLKMFCFYGG